MNDYLRWINDQLSSEHNNAYWLDERKYEFMPLAKNALLQMLSGYPVLLVTDSEREWFAKYALYFLNKPNKNRPLIPIYGLKEVYPNIDFLNYESDESVSHLFDMLSISFDNEYFFWYVGKSSDGRAKIALRKEGTFSWVFDEEFHNSFYLSSTDDLLDVKLMQLLRLFDKSLSAAIFGEVRLE